MWPFFERSRFLGELCGVESLMLTMSDCVYVCGLPGEAVIV